MFLWAVEFFCRMHHTHQGALGGHTLPTYPGTSPRQAPAHDGRNTGKLKAKVHVPGFASQSLGRN